MRSQTLSLLAIGPLLLGTVAWLALRDGAFAPPSPLPSPQVNLAQGRAHPGPAVAAAFTVNHVQRRLPGAAASATFSLSGRVVTTDGNPLPACAVFCGTLRATSDAQGGFLLAGLPPGEYWIRIEKEGFAQLPTPPVRAGAGTQLDVLVRMEPARTLQGRVLSSRGQALADARVELGTVQSSQRPEWDPDGSSAQFVLATRTDASGAFSIGPLSSESYTLSIKHPAHAGFGRLISADESPLVIRLHPLGSALGRVVDAETAAPVPIERLSVLVSRGDQEGPWQSLDRASWHAAEGLEVGSFRVFVRTGRYVKVVVYSADFAPTVSPPIRVQAGGESGSMLIRAQPGVRVRGQLMDDEGRPLAEGGITLINTPPLIVATLRCGPDGGFVSSPLAPGHYALRAHSPGYLTETIEEVVVPSNGAPDPLRIRLRAAGCIRGTVAAQPDGVLPGLWVRAKRLDALGSAWQRPAAVPVRSNRFEFPELEPGEYEFELRGQDAVKFPPCPPLAVARADVRGGASSSVSLDVSEMGSFLSGSLLLDGRPQPCAEVVLQREDHRLTWRCVTDAEGQFHFAALPSGAYRISHAADRPVSRTLQVNGPPARLSCDLDG